MSEHKIIWYLKEIIVKNIERYVRFRCGFLKIYAVLELNCISLHVLSRICICVTNNNGFWIGLLDLLALLLQLQSIITAYNHCLRLAPFSTGLRVLSLPLWRMTNEESLATELSWTELTYKRTEYRLPSPKVRVLHGCYLCFVCCYETYLATSGMCLLNRCLATVIFVTVLILVCKW
jgi:hypothetical protein